MNPIERAIQIVEGQSALAEKIGCSPQAVFQWKQTGTAPPKRCVLIEQATAGAVTRQQLRPDDWMHLWPELVTADHPAPTEAAA